MRERWCARRFTGGHGVRRSGATSAAARQRAAGQRLHHRSSRSAARRGRAHRRLRSWSGRASARTALPMASSAALRRRGDATVGRVPGRHVHHRQREQSAPSRSTTAGASSWSGTPSPRSRERCTRAGSTPPAPRKGARYTSTPTPPATRNSPAVSATANGDFAVAWQSLGQDGDSAGIFTRRFDSSGVAQGMEQRANTFTVGAQALPEVAVADDGKFVVVSQRSQSGRIRAASSAGVSTPSAFRWARIPGQLLHAGGAEPAGGGRRRRR